MDALYGRHSVHTRVFFTILGENWQTVEQLPSPVFVPLELALPGGTEGAIIVNMISQAVVAHSPLVCFGS